jgi:hypothetical protein
VNFEFQAKILIKKVRQAKKQIEQFNLSVFIKSASENPVLWTGMKDASAESRKKQTRC